MSEVDHSALKISLLALVLSLVALGTPTIGEQKVTELREWSTTTPAGAENVHVYHWDGVHDTKYSSLKDFTCKGDYRIRGLEFNGKVQGFEIVAKPGGKATCASYEQVKKTYLELYGQRLMLP